MKLVDTLKSLFSKLADYKKAVVDIEGKISKALSSEEAEEVDDEEEEEEETPAPVKKKKSAKKKKHGSK